MSRLTITLTLTLTLTPTIFFAWQHREQNLKKCLRAPHHSRYVREIRRSRNMGQLFFLGLHSIARACSKITKQRADKRWVFLSLVALPLWILFGNLLVLLSVVGFRHLRTLSNWVIASLAFTDFLLALTVVPFGIYQLVSCSSVFRCISITSLWCGFVDRK